MGHASSTPGARQLKQLEEKYFLQKIKLGEGSFSTVFRAIDRENGAVVAIKQMNKDQLRRKTGGAKPVDNVEKEVALMSACRHENIMQTLGLFEDATSLYVALEFCAGGDLADKVQEDSAKIPREQAAEWARQMCSAVTVLHEKRICHRDIKPANFMLVSPGIGGLLKLSDFGLAVFLPRGTLLSEKCGTPAYMSPELHTLSRRSRGYGFPADIWALGLCIYQMIYGGRHPFVDSRGQLDENLLLNGTLTFGEEDTASSSFGGLFKSLTLNLDMISGRPPVESDSADSAGTCPVVGTPLRQSAALFCWELLHHIKASKEVPPSPSFVRRQEAGRHQETQLWRGGAPFQNGVAKPLGIVSEWYRADKDIIGASLGTLSIFQLELQDSNDNKVAIISHAGNFQRSGTPGRIVPDGRKAEFVSVCSPLSATPGASFSNVSFSAEEPNSYRKLQLLQAKACQKGSTQLSWRCIIAATDDCQESAERFR
eukprot:CAMPEP_0115153976 /NCGR_PEP_ID=MMETSP0227-20121206/67030_1 /TAXON_ID=89957 /ORGANISM="Polarella glacialis, Strain CCMP 1383" /LENGTH=483 /DNA_ID=CAMNT_0002564785 /DNA_START=135 /DNA_END=1585 /DNA_ORIENTATION=+